MKNIAKVTFVALFLTLGTVLTAQNAPADWQNRMKSEKIAFLTTEIGLTPDEAQNFWPVYNKADEEKTRSFEAVMKAFRELDKAVREKKPEAELNKLLNTYTSAVEASQGIDAKYISQYKRIISSEKVAKLLIAEERFRNNQIYRLQRMGGGQTAPRAGHFPTPRTQHNQPGQQQ